MYLLHKKKSMFIVIDHPVKEKKWYRIINSTITKSIQNVYHVTKQNFRFVQAPYNKNKNEKWDLRSGVTIFDSEIMFFGVDWEEITSYGQKHFGETSNLLCTVTTA